MSYTTEQFDAARQPEHCDRCNYDTHRCHGCGEPLPHGVEVCDECVQRLVWEEKHGYWEAGDYQ